MSPTKTSEELVDNDGSAPEGLFNAEEVKRYDKMSTKVRVLKTYCGTIQACNVILNTLPGQSAADKVTSYESLMADLSSHNVKLSKQVSVWLKSAAGVK